MADHVASATGNQVALCTSNYGTTGSMIFFMGFDSAESVDAGTLMSDSTYMEAMGKTAELFLPDDRTLTQRLNWPDTPAHATPKAPRAPVSRVDAARRGCRSAGS